MFPRELLPDLALAPSHPRRGPQYEAEGVIRDFLTAFTAADQERVLGTFWPDAPFWGTSSPSLVTTPDGIRTYFQSLAQWRPGQRQASWAGGWSSPLTDTSVLISGLWQIATTIDGAVSIRALRMSAVVAQRGDSWRMAQFHNSARPGP